MSAEKNDGGPAFPGFGEVFTTDAQGSTGPQSLWGMHGAAGMSLRDFFAAAALIAHRSSQRHQASSEELVAKLCYADADAMLAARESKS